MVQCRAVGMWSAMTWGHGDAGTQGHGYLGAQGQSAHNCCWLLAGICTTPQLGCGHMAVPQLPQSRSSQSRAFRNRSGQVVINYWWVCHPNCALSSDHSQPFVWQRMPYKIFMHHLASLALSFFSRNIIALDAFFHFPKVFFSKGLKRVAYEVCRTSEQTSLHIRHLLGQASCVIRCLRRNICINKCIKMTYFCPFITLIWLSLCSLSTFCLSLTSICTREGHKWLVWVEETKFPPLAPEIGKSRTAELTALALVFNPQVWACERAQPELSLYTSNIGTTPSCTRPQEVASWLQPL